MVNEYASSSEYGGGPSPGYSGAGGGEAGSAYAAAASPSMGVTLTSVQLGANAPVTQLVASRQDGSNTYYTEVAPTPASTISPSQVAAAIQQPTVSELQRSDYTPIQQLGDTRTQQLMAQGYSPVQSLMMQTNAAKETPGLTDDRYYAGELQKAAQNYVAVSSEYHAWGKSTVVPVAANRYEYTGDLALGFLKGTEGKSGAQVTTPTDLSVLGLPGGRGIQDIAWGAAIGSEKLDYSGFVNAANVISRSASEQQMGPYGALASTAYIDGVGYRLTVPEQQAIAIQAAKTAGETIHPERLGTPWVIPSDIGLGSTYRGIGATEVVASYKQPFISKYASKIETQESVLPTRLSFEKLSSGEGLLNSIQSTAPLKETTSREKEVLGSVYATASNIMKTFPYAGALVGSVGYGYAYAPAVTSELPLAIGTGAGLSEVVATSLAANPIGWGAGLGIGAAMGLEKLGVLGVTGETQGLSARTIGAETGATAYRAGFSFMGALRSSELWEGVGRPVQAPGAYNLPKITEVPKVPFFSTPGEGNKQVVSTPGQGYIGEVSLPGEGRNLIAKVSASAISGGQGFFSGVIEMPKSTIEAYDIISVPGLIYAQKVSSAGLGAIKETGRPLFDLTVVLPKTATESRDQTYAALRSDNTYASNVAAAIVSFPASVAAPKGISSPFAYPTSIPTTYPSVLATPTVTPLTQSMPLPYVPATQTPFIPAMRYPYVPTTYTAPGPRPPQLPEIKTGTLPIIPRFDLGGGGSGGGIGKRRRNYLEEFRMGLDISFYGGRNTPRSPLPKFKGIPGSIQRKQKSPSAFKRKRKKS